MLPGFRAVEISNSTSPRCHERILRTLLEHGGPDAVAWGAGSDAHTSPRIAAAYTAAPGSTKDGFLDNVSRGVSSLGGASQGLPALVRDVYLVVGEYYRRLYGKGYPLPARRRLKNAFWSGLLFPGVILGVPAIVPALHSLRQEWIARFGRWDEHAQSFKNERRFDASAPHPT